MVCPQAEWHMPRHPPAGGLLYVTQVTSTSLPTLISTWTTPTASAFTLANTQGEAEAEIIFGLTFLFLLFLQESHLKHRFCVSVEEKIQ